MCYGICFLFEATSAAGLALFLYVFQRLDQFSVQFFVAPPPVGIGDKKTRYCWFYPLPFFLRKSRQIGKGTVVCREISTSAPVLVQEQDQGADLFRSHVGRVDSEVSGV